MLGSQRFLPPSHRPADQHLYFHVPFCNGKCAYCAFYSEIYSEDTADHYLICLQKEMELQFAGQTPAPRTLYFGGGTPSILPTLQLAQLCLTIRDTISTVDVEEWTVEANPGTLGPDKLHALMDAGVNRLSIGAQSFDDSVLRDMGRRHSAPAVAETIDAARRAGMANISIDLIAAFPGVNDTAWRETLSKTVNLGLQHVSVYALTMEEGSALGARVEAGALEPPEDDDVLRALAQAEETLTSAGYVRYETSNYAKPGFESRHNLACWRGEDYLGFGPAASSRAGLKRWTNRPGIKDYMGALSGNRLPPREEDTVTPETDATERLMFAFRLAEGVDLRRFATMPGSRPDAWQAKLNHLDADGLAECRNNRWYLTREGRNLADFVAGEMTG